MDKELFERDLKIRELKEILGTSISNMKRYYNHGHREEQFDVGDWVYLKLRPYRQHSISKKALYKLGGRFYGPFHILEEIGEVAYKLMLPVEAHIHPVIHVSQLKRRLGNGETVVCLPAVNSDGRASKEKW